MRSISHVVILLVLCCASRSVVAQSASKATENTTRTQSAKPQANEHKLSRPIELAKKCRDRVAAMSGYRAIFTKREIVGRTKVSQQMEVKIRRKPFSVYMKFIKPNAGREIVFTEGKNNGKMTVHLTGFSSLIGELNLAPDDPKVMAENRHQITSMGMERTLESLIKQWEFEKGYGEIDVKYYRNAKIGDESCNFVEAIHPRPRRQFKFHKSRLYISTKTGLPIRIEQFAFPPRSGAKAPIVEQYTYSKIQNNLKLADIDFSTKNPKYNF